MKNQVKIFALLLVGILASSSALISCSNGSDNPQIPIPSPTPTSGTDTSSPNGGGNNPETTAPEQPQADTTPPAEVSNITATTGNGSVMLSWTNSADNDFASVEITFTPAADNVTQPITTTGQAGVSSNVLVEGLTNGATYNFILKTVDTSGNKSQGQGIAATPIEPADTTPPAEVSNTNATAGNASVMLSWRNPSDNDFSSVEIEFTPSVENINQPILVSCQTEISSTKLIEGLANGVEYTFILKTIDTTNNKSSGITIKSTPELPPDLTPPAEVNNITASPGNKNIEITWTNPSDIDFYATEISYSSCYETSSTPIIRIGNQSATDSYTITGLRNNTTYNIVLKTIDRSGNKSSGHPITATTDESSITMNVTQPNDKNGNIILTKDSAPIKVKLTSTDAITKAVWKKGNKNTNVSASSLLSDASSTNFTINSNLEGTFSVTQNGFYDIAVQNEDGKTVVLQIEVKTIDKIPLDEVTNISVYSQGGYAYLEWNNPVAKNEYDSQFSSVKISYSFDCGKKHYNGDTIQGNYNKVKILYKSDDGNDLRTTACKMNIVIQTVDKIGNCSSGISSQSTCEPKWHATTTTLSKLFEEIGSRQAGDAAQIIITGTGSVSDINSAFKYREKTLKYTGSIVLDLTDANIIDIEEHGFNSSTMNSIYLPKTLTKIITGLFASCPTITSLTIPESVIEIQPKVFHDKATSLSFKHKGPWGAYLSNGAGFEIGFMSDFSPDNAITYNKYSDENRSLINNRKKNE